MGKISARWAGAILGVKFLQIYGTSSGEPEHAELVEELEGILREIDGELRRLTYLS